MVENFKTESCLLDYMNIALLSIKIVDSVDANVVNARIKHYQDVEQRYTNLWFYLKDNNIIHEDVLNDIASGRHIQENRKEIDDSSLYLVSAMGDYVDGTI